METLIVVIALASFLTVLVRYARNDHFAGAFVRTEDHDELGPIDLRRHLVPRATIPNSR